MYPTSADMFTSNAAIYETIPATSPSGSVGEPDFVLSIIAKQAIEGSLDTRLIRYSVTKCSSVLYGPVDMYL